MKLKAMVRRAEGTDLPENLPPVSDISVQRLIDDSLLALYREVKNLLTLSAKGKLDPSCARDLRDHLKLLFELKDREKDSLQNITDDQLKDMLEKGLLIAPKV